jgi:hypothetical protein
VVARERMRMESIPVIEAKCLLVKEKRGVVQRETCVYLTRRDAV